LMAAPTAFSARGRVAALEPYGGLTISRRVFPNMPSAFWCASTPTGKLGICSEHQFFRLRGFYGHRILSCSCRSFHRRPSASTTRITSIACIRSSWRPRISLSLVRFCDPSLGDKCKRLLGPPSPPRSRRTSGRFQVRPTIEQLLKNPGSAQLFRAGRGHSVSQPSAGPFRV